MTEALIIMVLLTLLAVATVGIVAVRNLFAVAILTGVYSLLMASVLLVLDAVDVAMTEATVGAGIATVLMLGTLSLTKTEEDKPKHSMVPCRCSSLLPPVRFWSGACRACRTSASPISRSTSTARTISPAPTRKPASPMS